MSESASVCLKLPENSFAQLQEVQNKSCLEDLFPDKLDRFRDFCKKPVKDLQRVEGQAGTGQVGKGKDKKVTFVEEGLEFSFGNL